VHRSIRYCASRAIAIVVGTIVGTDAAKKVMKVHHMIQFSEELKLSSDKIPVREG